MNSSNNNSYPQFVKVFLPNRSSHSLLIPPAFKDKISRELPNKVILQNVAGKSWFIEVKTIGNKSYFQGGWSKFVLENSLRFGEFMVFKYNKHIMFYVVILGLNGCDKELGTSSSRKKLVEENEDEDEDGDGDGCYDDDEEEDEMMTNVKFNKRSLKQNSHIAINGKNGDEDKDEDKDEDEDDNEDEDEDEDEHDDEDEDEDEDEDSYEDEDEDLQARKSREILQEKKGRKARANIVKGIELSEGIMECIPKKNPYFITKLKKSDYGYDRLLIPKSAGDTKISNSIVLQDEKDRNWNARKSVWNNGQVWIVGGWRDFCNSNQVKENDTIICELLLQSNKTCDNIKFQIVKPGEYRQMK